MGINIYQVPKLCQPEDIGTKNQKGWRKSVVSHFVMVDGEARCQKVILRGRLECPCARLQAQVYDNPNKL